MAEVKDFRKVSVFSGGQGRMIAEVTYDFAADGGAVSVLDLMQVKNAVIIMQALTKVDTAVTSGGAATVEIGIKGGDTDAILAATAPAGLLANTVLDGAAASSRLLVAADAIISLEIKVAALTAGKLRCVLDLYRF